MRAVVVTLCAVLLALTVIEGLQFMLAADQAMAGCSIKC